MGKHKPGEKDEQFENSAPPNQVTIGDIIQKLDRKINGANNSALQAQDNLDDAKNLLIALVQMYEQNKQYIMGELKKISDDVVQKVAYIHELEDLLKANNIALPTKTEKPTTP